MYQYTFMALLCRCSPGEHHERPAIVFKAGIYATG